MNFDQLSALYYRYKVNALSVKIFCMNNHATERVYASLMFSNVSSVPSTIKAIMENSKWALLSTNGNR